MLPAVAQSGEETPVVEFNLRDYDAGLVDNGKIWHCGLHSVVHDLYQIWCQGKSALLDFSLPGICQRHLQVCVDHGKIAKILSPAVLLNRGY